MYVCNKLITLNCMTYKTASKIDLIVSILYFIIIIPLIVVEFFFELGLNIFSGILNFLNKFVLTRFKDWLRLKTYNFQNIKNNDQRKRP